MVITNQKALNFHLPPSPPPPQKKKNLQSTRSKCSKLSCGPGHTNLPRALVLAEYLMLCWAFFTEPELPKPEYYKFCLMTYCDAPSLRVNLNASILLLSSGSSTWKGYNLPGTLDQRWILLTAQHLQIHDNDLKWKSCVVIWGLNEMFQKRKIIQLETSYHLA